MALPSGATMRLRPPRTMESHGNPHDQRATVRPVSTRPSRRSPLIVLPELPTRLRESLRPDPDLDRVLLHVDALDAELDDARCSAGTSAFQTVANSASRIVTSRSVISSLPSRFVLPRPARPAPVRPAASECDPARRRPPRRRPTRSSPGKCRIHPRSPRGTRSSDRPARAGGCVLATSPGRSGRRSGPSEG